MKWLGSRKIVDIPETRRFGILQKEPLIRANQATAIFSSAWKIFRRIFQTLEDLWTSIPRVGMRHPATHDPRRPGLFTCPASPAIVPNMTVDRDTQVRLAAFRFLEEQTSIHGDVLPRSLLEKGFFFEGSRVPLVGPAGIFKPAIMKLPLSFCTVPPTLRHPPPYADGRDEDGFILYKYRGTDVEHRDNTGLRRAMERGLPLIYFSGVVPGLYEPVWPAYVIGDEPRNLTFRVAVDDHVAVRESQLVVRQPRDDGRRQYITVQTQHRLHQHGFRHRVLRVYHDSCAICRLRHPELLEAAHILSDKHPEGQPIIPNGIALCKLHHAAFDSNILGIRPETGACVIEVRRDVLEEEDGPMLRQGLQAVNGQRLHVPRTAEFKPDKHRLEIRYELFKKAS